MLKLVRRPVAEFLDTEHQQSLKNRVESAQKLAADVTLTSAQKSSRIGSQWDNFRAGRTSKGTFAELWRELRNMSFEKCTFCETPSPGTAEHLEEKSKAPGRAFDWNNLLAACDTCNRIRENSGISTAPIDPSEVDPLDYFGWDEYGDLAPAPAHTKMVEDLRTMYGLHRFGNERRDRILVLRTILSAIVDDDAKNAETVNTLRVLLNGSRAWLGPVREYLLKPPTDEDALLVRGVLELLPEIRKLVEPWLRPPPWAPSWWR
ncbi:MULTISPECIES: hypothetical protein [Sorangium]|uniref:hypothetical protein n=1 Tax=Sorangium TaxID=39643 RepID=UPI00101A239B|nr:MULTISPECIES: hypothetical protein [Sorangium]